MDTVLAHEESGFINFRHHLPDAMEHGYRWVSIKHLRFSARAAESAGDRELLAALIGHEQFRDDYAGGGVMPEGTRHGPYWRRLITADLYEPLSQEKAVEILREWVGPRGEVPAGLEAELRREVFARLAAADGIHYLGERSAMRPSTTGEVCTSSFTSSCSSTARPDGSLSSSPPTTRQPSGRPLR